MATLHLSINKDGDFPEKFMLEEELIKLTRAMNAETEKNYSVIVREFEKMDTHELHILRNAYRVNDPLMKTPSGVTVEACLALAEFVLKNRGELHGPAIPEAPAIRNDYPSIQDLVMEDMRQRKHMGILKHGGPLQPFNGRDALMDAYQESLDQTNYLRQALFERDGK